MMKRKRMAVLLEEKKMKKRVLAMLLSGVLLATSACGGTTGDTTQEEATEETADSGESAEEETGDIVTTGGIPWLDSNLKENIKEDVKPDEKEDFHLAVNHDWLMENDLPDGYASYTTFDGVADAIRDKAEAVLTDETLTGHDVELVQSYYNAFLDWDARNEIGMAPAEEVVQEIQGLSGIGEISELLCDPERSFRVPSFVNVGNEVSLNDSTKYMLWMDGDGFILGDAAEYGKRTEMGDRNYDAYKKEVVALLGRIGFDETEAGKLFDDTIDFEGKLAEVSYTSSDQMASDYIEKINNVMPLSDVTTLASEYPLEQRLEAFGYTGVEDCLVTNPDYVKRLGELYTEENAEAIKAYMLVGYIMNVGYSLDREAYEICYEAENEVDGSSGMKPDEDEAFNTVRGVLTEPMDRAYLAKYDATKMKQQVTGICEDVIAAYRKMLDEEDWLSDETKERAIEKLDAITINAVYPEKWESDYAGLDLDGASYYECAKRISDFKQTLDTAKTNGTVDKEIWGFDILETNAYYYPNNNSINIILGILGGAFYQDGFSEEELYGGIGSVIGHEISHAFDTNGAQYDKDGNFADWWEKEDYDAFGKRADKLVDYYDGITAWEGQNVIGTNIKTEAIADMAGMKAILRIAQDIDGFDYGKFFKQYATVWARIDAREKEYEYLTQDTHPLHFLRTNVTVQQFDEFYDAFGVTESDNMYLAPEKRILVW